MFEETFGLIPRKKVSYDGENLKIKNEIIPIRNISKVYFQPFDFANNDWGAMYFSLTGEDNTELFNNREVKFTKGQTDKALKLLEILEIEVVDRNEQQESDLDAFDLEAIKTLEEINKRKERENATLCPKCQSGDLEYMRNVRKSFSVGKAAGGALLTGGLGTLAGFAGKKGKTNLWHCKNCGNTFEAKEK